MKRKKKKPVPFFEIQFAAPVPVAGQEFKLNYPTDQDKEESTPSFWCNAYNGGPMQVDNWPQSLVIDMKGFRTPRQDMPVRLQHDRNKGVGHTEKITVEDGKWLSISGKISRETKYAEDVISSAKKGFPWSVSIGALVTRAEKIPKGKSVEVNGRVHVGPVIVARESLFNEVSFVDLGADVYARAYVSAQNGFGSVFKGDVMGKRKGQVEAENDQNQDDLSEEVEVELEAEADEGDDLPAPKPKAKPKKVTASKKAATTVTESDEEIVDPITEHRKAFSAEVTRTQAITKLCGNAHPTILAQAIAEGWTVDKTDAEVNKAELAAFRAKMPKGFAVHVNAGDSSVTGEVLEAAVALAGNLENVDKHYKPEVLEAAQKRFKAIGLKRLLYEAARMNGEHVSAFAGEQELLRAAFSGKGMVEASGLSTIDISGILSNIANKFILQGFNFVEDSWREIAAIANYNDFKTRTSYRMLGDGLFELLPPGGEIKHATLGEQSFTNRITTYARMLAIKREDIINDDLNAITTVPQRLGRGAALALNKKFWAVFLDDSAFFTSGNTNLITDALGSAGLEAATVAFMNLVDPDGNPLGTMPEILLVPPDLSVTASNLVASATVWPGTGAGTTMTRNPFEGKFRVVVSRYLTDATDWYMLGNPRDLPVIEVAFLNGQQTPTIETADADFNVLGIQMRGYYDFGVALQDPLGGIKAGVTGS